MILKKLLLHNFRSYHEYSLPVSFTTLITGPNTAGKTNIIESIWLLATGKSFRAEQDVQMITFNEEVARVKASIEEDMQQEIIEVVVAYGPATGGRLVKRYLLNDIAKRRVDFAGRLPAVLFSPEELDIVSGSPSLRRAFLHMVLEQVDNEYRRAGILYDKALRRRNALLSIAKETGKRVKEQFSYWDNLLITSGQYITKKRIEFITFMNTQKKDMFTLHIEYDASTVSEERLAHYADAEVGAGVTLVGPHRDDILIYHDGKNLRYFGSRGQQRLAVLQLKLFQLLYIETVLQKKPLLLLDDIFSELDSRHMGLVLSMIDRQQTIMTTTHKEFLDMHPIPHASVVELKKD